MTPGRLQRSGSHNQMQTADVEKFKKVGHKVDTWLDLENLKSG